MTTPATAGASIHGDRSGGVSAEAYGVRSGGADADRTVDAPVHGDRSGGGGAGPAPGTPGEDAASGARSADAAPGADAANAVFGVGAAIGAGVVVGVGSAETAAWLERRGLWSYTSPPSLPSDSSQPSPPYDAEPGALLRAVVETVLRRLPAPERERVPVILAAAGPCVHAATRYALRWADTERRLRPSDSTALETSELVRGLGVGLGWRGPLYVLAAPGAAGAQALAMAGVLARGGRPAVVAELLRAPDGRMRPPAPARRGGPRPAAEPEWLAVAALRPANSPFAHGELATPASAGRTSDDPLPGVLLRLAVRAGTVPVAAGIRQMDTEAAQDVLVPVVAGGAGGGTRPGEVR